MDYVWPSQHAHKASIILEITCVKTAATLAQPVPTRQERVRVADKVLP